MALLDEARAAAVRANVSLGIGLAALASGALVYFSAPSAPARTAVWLTPAIGTSQAGLVTGGRF
jgi:hypothetical protein